MHSEKEAWSLREHCMEMMDEKGRVLAAPFLAAADLLAVLAAEHKAVRISDSYRAAYWMDRLKVREKLSQQSDGWFLSEDPEWKNPESWKPYEQKSEGKLLIDYHRGISFTGLRDERQSPPFAEKWRALGYTVRETDGHDHEKISRALREAKGTAEVIIVHTQLPELSWEYPAYRKEEFTKTVDV